MKLLYSGVVLVVGLLPAFVVRAANGAESSLLPADAPCLKEQWSKARTLVWAKPGEGGTAMEAGNWTQFASGEDYAGGKGGKPAASIPDAKTDIVLPDAPDGKPYIVGFMVRAKHRRSKGKSEASVFSCRHVTVGSGVAFDGGIGVARGRSVTSDSPDDDTPINIYGNVSVKDGGAIYGPLNFVGDKHTQFSVGKSPEPLARSLSIRKTNKASVTLIASRYDLLDEVTVESGRLVLATGTNLRINATLQARIDLKKLRKRGFGRDGPCIWIREQAALEMHPGSRIGRVNAPEDIVPDMRIEGLLQIARPSGPNDAPAVIELTIAAGDGKFLNQPGGLYIRSTAEVRNLGRLSITAGNPEAKASGKGLSIFLEKSVDLGKVSIDYLRAGGVAATDQTAAKKALAAATFGKNCAANGDAMYSKIEFISFKGGFGAVEFVDGLSTECEILFPLGERLIVRSKGNRTVQSFALKSVHSLVINGKRTEYNSKRSLSAGEQELRKLNVLWADVPGKGQIGSYGEQKWPKAPLMVWRRPGQAGSRFVAANWLDETGRPYFKLPARATDDIYKAPESQGVDVLLPAGHSYYQVAVDRPQWDVRHMTVESNAFFHLTYNIAGNLWMKDGSGKHAPWFGAYRNATPGLHRFLRLDGKRIGRPGTVPWPLSFELPEAELKRIKAARDKKITPRSAGIAISRWGNYLAGKGGTLEITGTYQVGDQFYVKGEGTIIISEGGYLAPGGRSSFAIEPGATVVLLQDARIGCEIATMQAGRASVWVGGTLMIGTPQRPITRDMLFPVTGIEEDRIIRNPAGSGRTPGVSLLVGKKGRLVLHSADPTKARLIFKMHDSAKARKLGKQWGDAKGVVLAFFGESNLNGVVFDNVLEGGIMVSPEQRKIWKNISYGKNNLAEPEKLYWDLKSEEDK
jgi:hypothetical protein